MYVVVIHTCEVVKNAFSGVQKLWVSILNLGENKGFAAYFYPSKFSFKLNNNCILFYRKIIYNYLILNNLQ